MFGEPLGAFADAGVAAHTEAVALADTETTHEAKQKERIAKHRPVEYT